MSSLVDRLTSSTKRKLDDSSSDPASDSPTRSKKPETRVCSSSPSTSSSLIHFFIRTISTGKTIVIHANSTDTILSIHEQIHHLTGIPVFEQRLIYRGKQLDAELTLEKYGIQNDAGLNLVGRMRSTDYPETWQVVHDLVTSILFLCRGGGGGGGSPGLAAVKNVKTRVKEFLQLCLRGYEVNEKDRGDEVNEKERVNGHFKIFKSAGAPMALVMLYISVFKGNKECGEEGMRLFQFPNLEGVSKCVQGECLEVLLEFCKLLKGNVEGEDGVYVACRSSIGRLLDDMEVGRRRFGDVGKECLPFVVELAGKLMVDLDFSWNPSVVTGLGLESVVGDFSKFLRTLCRAIRDHLGREGKIPIDMDNKEVCCMPEVESLHVILLQLLEKVNQCLHTLEDILIAKGPTGESESLRLGWSQYIPILKELSGACELFKGGKDMVSSVMWARRLPLNVLIRYLKRSERSDEHHWLFHYKDVTDFESRRHLVMMLFPETVDEYEELHEMLIDRSQLLEESFEYIGRASPASFRGGLFMEFKNEEATGPGVLREWFYLVCQAIFNPQNPLFLPCPNDQRRFFPNPASKVDSMHLDYFGFCGRMIALALMNKVHVGIVFDRIFFLQLAGKSVSLEDVRDADPCLYMSCKKILEMDAEFLDSDALGLTFVREIEELGSRKVVELCRGGKGIIVNSKNRVEYVQLLIQHRFVTSISEQVARFGKGFADILFDANHQKLFFQSLKLEDLDLMLHGSDNAICVKEWKAHTDYHGYRETDRQICWFWKVVEGMSTEQQRILLFFWTSVKYLPVEGFGGLPSRLQIYKASDSHDRLPSSHTCFYRLCVPPYPTVAAMQDSLHFITQEHVSSSFGNW